VSHAGVAYVPNEQLELDGRQEPDTEQPQTGATGKQLEKTQQEKDKMDALLSKTSYEISAARGKDLINAIKEYYASKDEGGCYVLRHAIAIEDNESCPDECQYWAEDISTPHPCIFKCVTANECGRDLFRTRDTDSIPDHGGFCRPCELRGCKECHPQLDECISCKENFGFTLNSQGRCDFAATGAELMVFWVAFMIFIILLIWYCSFACCRKATNLEQEEKALRYRSGTKLTQGKFITYEELEDDDNEEIDAQAKLFPLCTNIFSEPIAGPASPLYFRFMIFVMFLLAWAYLLWEVVAPDELMSLGTADFSDEPRLNCKEAIVEKTLAADFKRDKITYLLVIYCSWFVMCIVFAIWQKRTFNSRFNECVLMSHFTARLSGLPAISGSSPVERTIANHIREATGQEVIGVSIGWDYGERKNDARKMLEILEDDADRMAEELWGSRSEQDWEVPAQEPRFWPFRMLDKFVFENILGISTNPRGDLDYTFEQCEQVATECKSSPYAFVVFPSESARDAALAVGPTQFKFYSTLTLEIPPCEPVAVRWLDFDIPRHLMPMRIVKATLYLVLTVIVQTCLYLPYALWAASLEVVENGEDPTGFVHQFAIILVLFSNFAVFLICANTVEAIGFIDQNDANYCYMIMYIFASLAGFITDMVVECFIAYAMACSNRVRSVDGVLVMDLITLYDILNIQDMERRLGAKFQEWLFPSLFLLPYLFEPVFLGWLAFHLQRRCVRVFPHLRGADAEAALSILGTMDSGRYADVLVNMISAMLITFLPGGFYAYVVLAALFSNVYIFLLDTHRILRWVPAFSFNRSSLDGCAQVMLSLPLAMVLSAVVWESFCYDWATHKPKTECHASMIWFTMFGAFFGHMLVHILILQYVVPILSKETAKDVKRSKHTSYSVAASVLPNSYFNTNPMHCIRSRYYYLDDPPCVYYVHGKEHLLKRNEKIGAFYERRKLTEEENYWWW